MQKGSAAQDIFKTKFDSYKETAIRAIRGIWIQFKIPDLQTPEQELLLNWIVNSHSSVCRIQISFLKFSSSGSAWCRYLDVVLSCTSAAELVSSLGMIMWAVSREGLLRVQRTTRRSLKYPPHGRGGSNDSTMSSTHRSARVCRWVYRSARCGWRKETWSGNWSSCSLTCSLH